MTSLVFYEEIAPLNQILHKDLCLSGESADYSYARNTNSVVVTGSEFGDLCKEYPIVFSEVSPGHVVPVVILGLRNEENLFVDHEGSWQARYVPGFVRRYPFVMAEMGEAKKWTLCFDQKSDRFSKTLGSPLFDEDGEKSELLNQITKFQMEYQAQYARTERFMKHVIKMDLLTPFTGAVQLRDGQRLGLNGLMIIDEQKLLKLEREKAYAFMRTGELAWVYSHLISLANFSRLGELLDQRTEDQ